MNDGSSVLRRSQGLQAPWERRLLIGTLVFVPIAYAIIALYIRVSIERDSAWGLLILDAMRHGGSFNYLVSPDQANIANDHRMFLTKWSPGQYLFPGLFEFLGLNLGDSLILTITLFLVLGVLGWYAFYHAAGFPLRTIAISCLLMICTQWFTKFFGEYYGGETLLFGVAPWATLLFWKLRDLSPPSVLPLIAALIALAFFKLSGPIYGLALLGACLFSVNDGRLFRTPQRWLVAAIVTASFGVVFYFLWLAKGLTAATTAGSCVAGLSPISLVFPIVAPAMSIVGFTDFLHRLSRAALAPPGLPSPKLIIELSVPIVATMYVIVWLRLRKEPKLTGYTNFASITFLLFTLAFIVLYLRNAAIDIQERHFRSVGLLLLPGIVQAFSLGTSRWLRGGFYLAIVGSVVYGAYAFYCRERENLTFPLGAQGYRQDEASPRVVEFIRGRFHDQEDSAKPIVYVSSSVLALEFAGARLIVPAHGKEAVDVLASRRYRGHVQSIYIFLEKRMLQNGKAQAILRSFVNYDGMRWRQIDLGDYVCFFQNNAPAASLW